MIRKKNVKQAVNIEIPKAGEYVLEDGRKLRIAEPNNDREKHLWVKKDKIHWPINIRSTLPGDKIAISGIDGGRKSIKKYLIDKKVNRFEKEAILLVCDGDQILQIMGMRTNRDYLSSDIKNALTFKIVG